MIPIFIADGKGFLYDVEVVKQLREEYHICGVLAGILPQFPQQNIFGGLPLQLMPEDVEYLLEKGNFFITDDEALHTSDVPEIEEPEIFQGNMAIMPMASRFREALDAKALTSPTYVKPKPERYQIYKYFMNQGFFLMPGLRFGCQFMAYPGDLMRYHSHYNVLGYAWDQPFPILDIVGGGRLATSVKKCWVVGATNPESNETEVFSIEWAGFG